MSIENSRLRFVLGSSLDDMLHKGYYRSGRDVINDHEIYVDEQIHKVYWLRYNLKKYVATAKHRQILNRCQKFKTVLAPFEYTDDLDLLYQRYRQITKFTSGESFFQYLYYLHPLALHDFRFQSFGIHVYDGDERIALGVIDAGKKTIAGIANIYLPEYKKYSLGKYMMLFALQTAIQNNMKYYYPGYISPTTPYFDYKLFIGENCTEILDTAKNKWLPFDEKLMQ